MHGIPARLRLDRVAGDRRGRPAVLDARAGRIRAGSVLPGPTVPVRIRLDAGPRAPQAMPSRSWIASPHGTCRRRHAGTLLTDQLLRSRVVNLGATLRMMATRRRAESRHVGGDVRLDAFVARLTADPSVADAQLEDDIRIAPAVHANPPARSGHRASVAQRNRRHRDRAADHAARPAPRVLLPGRCGHSLILRG